MHLLAPMRSYKSFKAQVKALGPSDEEWKMHLEKEMINFYNFMSCAMYMMSTAFDKQMSFRNVLAEAKGLSKVGRILFGKLGAVLSDTSYKRLTALHLDTQDAALR